MVEQTWPLQTLCKPLLGFEDLCFSHKQCTNDLFCGYGSKAEKDLSLRRCRKLYALDDGETFGWDTNMLDYPNSAINIHLYNGQSCSSGVAIQSSTDAEVGICASTEVKFNGVKLSAPYKCDPTDNSVKCQLFFGTGVNDKIDTPCRCGLDGVNGYCGAIYGTPEYKQAIEAYVYVLESNNCHTEDRYNLRAMKEKCGIGMENDQWSFSMNKMFNMTYWPYIHDTDVFNCIQSIFSNSFNNMTKGSAFFLLVDITAIVVFIAYY